MYFPYLRGRQFELIALREFAVQRGDQNNVFPIIEPVKKTFNSLKLAIKKFSEGDLKFAIVLNPQVGDLIGNNNIIDELEVELVGTKWIPAFIVKNNFAYIRQKIEAEQLTNVMLICTKSVDASSNDFLQLIASSTIEYIVSEENKSLKRRLRDQNKKLILLSDCFKPLIRNKDYLEAQPEKFTEEHLFYEEENYFGFADYTTVSSEFNEGGTTPYAVAIHLTYQNENDEIWLRHFTSISNDDQANIQGKFAEAAGKAVRFLNEEDIHTYSSEELRTYYQDEKYPGLGTVKKISIKNHIELVNSIL